MPLSSWSSAPLVFVCKRFVFCTRVETASSSDPSVSLDEDAEPDRESSRPTHSTYEVSESLVEYAAYRLPAAQTALQKLHSSHSCASSHCNDASQNESVSAADLHR